MQCCVSHCRGSSTVSDSLEISRQSPASTSDNSAVPAQKAQACSLAFEYHLGTALCLDHQSPHLFMWLAPLMWATVDSSDEP